MGLLAKSMRSEDDLTRVGILAPSLWSLGQVILSCFLMGTKGVYVSHSGVMRIKLINALKEFSPVSGIWRSINIGYSPT